MSDGLAPLVYETSYWAIHFALKFGFSLRITGRHHLPKSGPALLVANHQSFLDPIAIGLGSPRHLTYLARQNLFRIPIFGDYLRIVNTIPIDRDGMGKDGLMAILDQLNAGEPVLIFPEGTRTTDGKLQPLRPGISLLIKRTQAPVVPIGIAGAHRAWPKGCVLPRPSPLFLRATDRTIGVAFGPPRPASDLVRLPREEFMATLAGDIQKAMAEAERARRKPPRPFGQA